jgi:hypothetical protein
MVSAKVNNVYAICAFAAIGGGLFGFDISSMSGVLGTNAYKNYFDNPQDTRVRYQYSTRKRSNMILISIIARWNYLCYASWVSSWGSCIGFPR